MDGPRTSFSDSGSTLNCAADDFIRSIASCTLFGAPSRRILSCRNTDSARGAIRCGGRISFFITTVEEQDASQHRPCS